MHTRLEAKINKTKSCILLFDFVFIVSLIGYNSFFYNVFYLYFLKYNLKMKLF